MKGKIPANELEKIIAPLPTKERIALREQLPDKEWLQAQTALCQQRMKRDLWVGPIWAIAYGIALFTTQYSATTIGIFALGVLYFGYTIFTTGSFGLNKKRVKVYGDLLERMG